MSKDQNQIMDRKHLLLDNNTEDFTNESNHKVRGKTDKTQVYDKQKVREKERAKSNLFLRLSIPGLVRVAK